MEEIWKDIPGYEGLYQASTLGRIKSLAKYRYSIYGKKLMKEKILKLQDDGMGMRTCLCKKGSRKDIAVHKVIAATFLKISNFKKYVLHLDNDYRNNRVDNLCMCSLSKIKKYYKRTYHQQTVDYFLNNKNN